MNSRTLINLFLLLTLVIFISVYITKKNKPEDIQRLTSLSLDEITSIRIPRENGKDIVLRKDKHGAPKWHMTEPYSVMAHQFRVNTLLSLTQSPIKEAYEAASLDLSHYALDKPRSRIIFDETEISFGKTNPINNKRYLLSNDKIVLLDDQTYPLVSSQAATFVDLTLLHNSDITTLSLPKYNIEKNQTGAWTSTPQESNVSALTADQIQSLLQNWNHAQAFAVHRHLKRKYFDKINVTIDNTSIEFLVSDIDPWLILARPDLGIEYHLDASQIKNLLDPNYSAPVPEHTESEKPNQT